MEYVQIRENTPEAPRAMSADINTGIVRNVSLGTIIVTTKFEPFVKLPSVEVHFINSPNLEKARRFHPY